MGELQCTQCIIVGYGTALWNSDGDAIGQCVSFDCFDSILATGKNFSVLIQTTRNHSEEENIVLHDE